MSATIEKLFPSGMYLVSEVVNGQLIKYRYGGYTKREALRRFAEYKANFCKQLLNPQIEERSAS